MGRRREALGRELGELSCRMRGLAGAQGGVVSAAQAHGLGADKADLRRLLAGEHWLRARRGVYRDPTFIPPVVAAAAACHRRCAALLAALAAPAVISHGSAARLLGLPLPPGCGDGAISITRRPPAPPNDPLGGDVHVSDYEDAHVIGIGGVPVLAGARLVLDCCEAMPPDSALAVADAALRRDLVTHDELAWEVQRRRGRPGSLLAAAIVERADRGATNWFESVSRWWLLEGGLPVPELQVRFADGNGDIRACVDMWFSCYRTVGEADGAGKYDEPGSLFAEKRREDWLRDTHQVEVVRWVPAELRTPHTRREVVDRFHRAFARRA